MGDPIERIRSTPKEALVQRASSPRRPQTPTKSADRRDEPETALELLPKLTGTRCGVTNAHQSPRADANVSLREKLLESKLAQCCVSCVFEAVGNDGNPYRSTDVLSDGTLHRDSVDAVFISPLERRNREIKRQTLTELIELVSTPQAGPFKAIPDTLYPNFFHMVSSSCQSRCDILVTVSSPCRLRVLIDF